MATAAVDKDEDVLTCTVCLDSYTDPCTLQCKHSFCRRCITDYIKTQDEAIQNKMIPCPFCRQVTRVLAPARPVIEWAGQLEPALVIKELVATVNKDTVVEDIPCFPCQQLGETTPGKLWCTECEVVFCQRCGKTHSVMPTSRDHDFCDLKDKGQIKRRKTRCSEHRDKQLELYCKNCNVSHCHLCFVSHHRKCEDVVVIKSFVSEMKTELSDLINQLEDGKKKTNNIVEFQNTRISKLIAEKICVKDKIRCASKKAVDLIKTKEKQLIDQVVEITDKEKKHLKAKVKLGNIQMQTYRQYSEYIKQALGSDSEMEVCDVYQVWKSGQLKVSQEGDKDMGGDNISSVRFSQQKQNITGVLDSLHLGEIITTYFPTDSLSSPVLVESVDARMNLDMKDPDLCGVTVLEVRGVNTAVAIDYNNMCVKSFYTRSNRMCQSRLELNHSPWGITELEEDKVMVVVPNSNEIVTVKVTPDLVHVTNINTSKPYFGLALMSPSTVAAGGCDSVDILNIQGQVLKSVTAHNNMKLFDCPCVMCFSNNGHLLVSDSWKESVTSLTSEGEVVWIYSGTGKGKFISTLGITTTGDGDILVADSNSKKVIQLSESGEYVRDVVTSLDGLRYPKGICLDKHGSMFICDSDNVLKFYFVRK